MQIEMEYINKKGYNPNKTLVFLMDIGLAPEDAIKNTINIHQLKIEKDIIKQGLDILKSDEPLNHIQDILNFLSLKNLVMAEYLSQNLTPDFPPPN